MVTASVVIPAHNESAVVARCLRALLADAGCDELEVVVVANGCSDDTAAVARRTAQELGAAGAGVVVLDRPEPGKVGALNAGDAVASAFPRIYLDADAVLSTRAALATAAVLAEAGGPLAAAPRPVVAGARCHPLVRWHYETWAALPVTRDAYVGSGVYAVSRAGHARVVPFPDVVADDDYVRRSFARSERAAVDDTFEVHPPRTVTGYLKRAARARRGNTELHASVPAHPEAETAPRGARGLLVLARDPRSWHRVGAFGLLTALSRLAVLSSRGSATGWNQDTSSRTPEGAAA